MTVLLESLYLTALSTIHKSQRGNYQTPSRSATILSCPVQYMATIPLASCYHGEIVLKEKLSQVGFRAHISTHCLSMIKNLEYVGIYRTA